MNVAENMGFVFVMAENNGKGGNGECLYFLLFPQCLPPQGFKTQDNFGKGSETLK